MGFVPTELQSAPYHLVSELRDSAYFPTLLSPSRLRPVCPSVVKDLQLDGDAKRRRLLCDDELQRRWTRCKARGEVATTLGSGSGEQDRSNGEDGQQDVDQRDGQKANV